MSACPSCGGAVSPGVSYCGQCGSQIVAPPSAGGAYRTIRIGREEDNDIRLPGDSVQVGRNHAMVTVDRQGSLTIQDLATRNGTFVNGVRVQGRVPFRLSDQVQFGSYLFNTATLQPLLTAGPPVAGGHGAPVAQPPVQPMGGGMGVPIGGPPGYVPPAVQVRKTFLDRAFSDEGSWMPQFLLVYGIILIGLFFLPMGAFGNKVLAPVALLGKSGASGWLKLMIALLPVVGGSLLVLRHLRSGKVVVGAALLAATLPALAVFALGATLKSGLPGATGWRLGFRWLFLCGTAFSLFYLGSRPRDSLGRTLLGVFASMLAMSYFFPVRFLGSSTVEIVVAIKVIERANPPVVMLVVLNLLPLVVALGSLAFLNPKAVEAHRQLAQNLGVSLCLLPAVSLFIFMLLLAVYTEKGGFILMAVWFALFGGYMSLFPVLGGTLLTMGLRPPDGQRAFGVS